VVPKLVARLVNLAGDAQHLPTSSSATCANKCPT
jgi:hypothetical protein